MIQGVYVAAFMLSMFFLIVLMFERTGKYEAYYALFLASIAVSCGGYMFEALSKTIEELVIATKLTSVGSCFSSFLLLCIIVKLENIKVSRKITATMVTYSSVVLIMIFTFDYHHLFYRAYGLGVTPAKIPYLITISASGYVGYLVLMVGYFSAIVAVLVRTIRRRDVMSIRVVINLIELTIADFVVTGIEVTCQKAHVAVVIAYVMEGALLLLLVQRLRQYDVSNVVSTYITTNNKFGFLTVDKNINYLGSNSVAKKMLPQLQQLKIDQNLFSQVTCLEEVVPKMIHEKHFEFIETQGRIIKCSIRRFKKRRHTIGYLIQLEDDTSQQKYLSLINKHNMALEEDVKQKKEHIHDIQDQIIVGMATIIENRDLSTGEHIKRTSEILDLFTQELQKVDEFKEVFTDEFCEEIVKAAPMHDIGKIVVEDSILRKEGKFTAEEFEKMKCHAPKGGQIVKEVLDGVEEKSFVEVAANMAAYHHEHWDGNGYEKGMAGTMIPIEARVMAFADVFDALVSERCYKKSFSCEQAIGIIHDSLGSQFDPKLGTVFLTMYDQLKVLYAKG